MAPSITVIRKANRVRSGSSADVTTTGRTRPTSRDQQEIRKIKSDILEAQLCAAPQVVDNLRYNLAMFRASSRR